MSIWQETIFANDNQELRKGKIPCDTYKMSELCKSYVAEAIKCYLCHCTPDKYYFAMPVVLFTKK